jgi:hypothetical protein
MTPGRKLMSTGARVLGVLLGILCAAGSELDAAAQSATTTIDIGKDRIGAAPAELDVSQGRWTVVRDATAKTGLALEQAGMPTAVDRFALAIYKAALVKNAEISLRLKLEGEESDRGGGVVVRLRSPQDYYLVQVDAIKDMVVFSRVNRGTSEEIAGVDAGISWHGWHTLTVRVVDDEFTISLDGKWMFTGFDKSLSQPGHVALWTKGNSVTRFDGIAITALPTSEERD